MNIIRPCESPSFAYRGGKARLRKFIARFLPESAETYCEPFAGRANVFFLAKRISSFNNFILNDIQTHKFLNAVKEYDGHILPITTKESAIKLFQEQNVDYLLLEPLIYWAGGLGSKSATGHRGHDLEEYRLMLLQAKEDLKSCRITNEDAIDCLNRLGENDFAYIDPPYINANVGIYNDGQIDRKLLIETLKNAKFKWLLSEYRCDDLLESFGEPCCIYKNVKVTPGGGFVKNVEEYLWSNYNAIPRIMSLEVLKSEPIKTSIQIFKDKKSLTFEEWKELVPEHWGDVTTRHQFNRLCYLDYAFFDGEKVSILC